MLGGGYCLGIKHKSIATKAAYRCNRTRVLIETDIILLILVRVASVVYVKKVPLVASALTSVDFTLLSRDVLF